MGCDIHQINVMIDKTGKVVLVDGEWPTFLSDGYRSKYVKMFCPGRSYDLFGVLASVRSNRPSMQYNKGVPKELEDYARKNLEVQEYNASRRDTHSDCWYFFKDLREECKRMMSKISLEASDLARQNRSLISRDISEEIWLWKSLGTIVSKIDSAERKMTEDGHKDWFEHSKVHFCFDN